MISNEAVYLLKGQLSDREFGGFTFGRLDSDEEQSASIHEKTLDLFKPVDLQRKTWRAPRLRYRWKPLPVIGDVDPDADFVMVDGFKPAFTQRAIDALRQYLEPNGELLPITVPEGVKPYWVYNVTAVADVLDQEHSILELFEGSSFAAVEIEYFAFRAEAIPPLSIFRIPQSVLETLVTERFAACVRETGLKGFRFQKVWPLPPGTKYWKASNKSMSSESAAGKASRARTAKFTTRALNKEEQKELRHARPQYEKLLCVNVTKMSVESILNIIQDRIEQLQASRRRDQKDLMEQAFLLGVAWGDLLVRDMRWKWRILVASKDERALAVVSPDQSLAVPAPLYMKRLALDSKADPTPALTFNMIKAGQFIGKPRELKLIS